MRSMCGCFRFCAWVFVALLAAGSVRGAATVHVNPRGDDAGDGSAARPFATLAAAQRQVRSLLARQRQPIRVEIAAGVYFLDQPLVLGNEDSGPTEDQPVVYAAAGGEVVLSGGRRIDGWRAEGGRWIAKIDVDDDAPLFRDLWINGRRAVRARTPNEGYFRVDAAGPDNRTSFTAAADELVELANPQAAEVALLHDWSMSRVRLAGIDAASRTYRTSAPVGGAAAQFAITNFEPHPRYFIEGAPELLDAAGEWHLDEQRGELHYLPREGEDIATAVAVAPRLGQLLIVRGQGDVPARHLRFEGLTFSHSWFDIPRHGYAGIQSNAYERRETPDDRENVSMPAAVMLDRTAACQFAGCRFEHLAACGLHVARSQDVRIERCGFRDIGGDGVLIGTRHDADSPATERIAATDCVIEDCGVNYCGAVGVWIGFAAETLIAHNEIRNLPYTGVSVGWRWDDTPSRCRANLIQANHIHHAMQVLSDGGGIYTLGRQPGTRLVENHIHDIPLNAGRAESNGMFIDEGSTEITIENNTIYNIARSPIRFHRAGKNLVARNRLTSLPGVPTFMYNATDEAVIDRVDNETVSAAVWQAPPNDPAASIAGPR
ncbi:MAG: hypothetical protein DCC67_04665 [Planctomycetota bacterium]|nr:MAG: hypothetical protein DCC67_04665 [Planctomycetota bacterium]